MQEKPLSGTPPQTINIIVKIMNIVATVGLVVFTVFAFFVIFSYLFEISPSHTWQIISDGLKSGLLELNDAAVALTTVFCFFPLGLWCLAALVLSFIAYLRKKGYVNKSVILWTSILLIVVVLIVVGLFVADSNCVPDTLVGSSTACNLPIRPGIVAPTPSS